MDTDSRTLVNRFTQAQSLFQEIESSTLNTRDPKYKELLSNAISSCQTCLLLFEQNNLLSPNEELEEVHTSVLKYLNLPYFLGELFERSPYPDTPQERKTQIQTAKKYYDKFLSTMISLKIVPEQIKSDQTVLTPEEQRNEKIKRYRRQEQIKKLIVELEQIMKSTDDDDDSEISRKCVLLVLEENSMKAAYSLNSLTQEEQIVSHMVSMIQEKGHVPPVKPERVEPATVAKPIVIEDRARIVANNAFKPGWNLPTVSVEQANLIDYEDAIKREKRQNNNENRQSIVAEYKDSQGEDVEDIYKQREFDVFKDNNPRGSGNTGTKGYKY